MIIAKNIYTKKNNSRRNQRAYFGIKKQSNFIKRRIKKKDKIINNYSQIVSVTEKEYQKIDQENRKVKQSFQQWQQQQQRTEKLQDQFQYYQKPQKIYRVNEKKTKRK